MSEHRSDVMASSMALVCYILAAVSVALAAHAVGEQYGISWPRPLATGAAFLLLGRHFTKLGRLY
ncbi:MAG: hypothetical protein L0027_16410 [Candidatus Rokubacteria bacterium]|nr:hypothetical protein [Candidatus Rokubacteria bacterium]